MVQTFNPILLVKVEYWDLSFLDAQTGSMNSIKMAMRVEIKFSSNSQENSTFFTVKS